MIKRCTGMLIVIALVVSPLSGCSLSEIGDGIGSWLDEVLDEMATVDGASSLGEATDRVQARRAQEAERERRRLEEETRREYAAERALLRDSGRSVCQAGSYLDFLLLVFEKHNDILTLRGDSGDGVLGQLGSSLARNAEWQFAEDLKDCEIWTGRLMRGELPLLSEDDRWLQMVGLMASETEAWHVFRSEIFPMLRTWVRNIYFS